MRYRVNVLFVLGLICVSSACQAYPASWKYHHLGVPTKGHSKKERYDPKWKYSTWGYDDSEFNIQMHRFDADAPFVKLLTTKPHIAFQVPNLKEAIKGRHLIWGPIESKPGLFVAIIKDPATGMPVELLQTSLSKEEAVKKYHEPLKKLPG